MTMGGDCQVDWLGSERGISMMEIAMESGAWTEENSSKFWWMPKWPSRSVKRNRGIPNRKRRRRSRWCPRYTKTSYLGILEQGSSKRRSTHFSSVVIVMTEHCKRKYELWWKNEAPICQWTAWFKLSRVPLLVTYFNIQASNDGEPTEWPTILLEMVVTNSKF